MEYIFGRYNTTIFIFIEYKYFSREIFRFEKLPNFCLKTKVHMPRKMYLHPIPIFDCLPSSSSRSIFLVCETKDDLRKMEKGIFASFDLGPCDLATLQDK